MFLYFLDFSVATGKCDITCETRPFSLLDSSALDPTPISGEAGRTEGCVKVHPGMNPDCGNAA